MAEDLTTAKIPKWTPEGKVDFHSFRVVFITRVVEADATVKEVHLFDIGSPTSTDSRSTQRSRKTC